MKKTKLKKVKKQRSEHYEKKVKLYTTFEGAIKTLVSEPDSKYVKKKS